MALYKRSETVRDFNGVAVSKVSVKVVTGDPYSETAPLASLFQDAAGLIPQANPLTADAAGQYSYWAAGGMYSEKVSRPGYYSITNDGFLIGGEKGDPGPQGNPGTPGTPGPDIRPQLDDGTNPANGSGMVAHNESLMYPAGSIGKALQNRVFTTDLAETMDPTTGANMIGFNSALAYAAGTVGKFLKDLGSSTGATLVGYLAPFTGAQATTQDVINSETFSIFRWLTPAQIANVRAGITDASVSTAIQAAINYVGSLGGGVIRFPRGTYTTINLLPATSVHLISGATTPGLGTSNSGAVFFKNPTTAGYCIDTATSGASNFAVSGINFIGPNATTPQIGGIRIGAMAYWCSIKSCSFSGFSDRAILLDTNSVACTVEDILAVNCLLNFATLAAPTGVVDVGGSDHYVSRCEIAGQAARGGTGTSAVTSASLYFCSFVFRTSNHFADTLVGEFSDIGIYVTSDSSSFVNCRADTNAAHGWRFASGVNQVTNCRAINNSQSSAGTYSGFYVNAAGICNLFSNCFSYNGAGTVKYGLEDNSTGGTVGTRSIVTNFRSIGHTTASYYAISLGAAIIPGNHQISYTTTGNQTIDVSDIGSINAYPAAALTITNFLNGVNGQSVKIACNGGPIVMQQGNFKNAAGVDKTLQQGRIYTYTRNDGVWYEETNPYNSATAMPTTGTWRQGDLVFNSAPTNAAGVAAGWIRITTGSGNVLNTDWRVFGVTV